MPATAQSHAADAAKRYPHLRPLTADEIALIAEAEKAGAYLRTDDAYAGYIELRAGLPICWSTYLHCEDYGKAAYEQASKRQAEKRDAFIARCRTGDLKALAERVSAGRVQTARAA